jgi:hypothetical protein
MLVAVAAGVVDAGLALHRRVQCGDHACSENEYCNTQFGNICSACGNVCDFSSHNYNHKDCYENCQGKTTTINNLNLFLIRKFHFLEEKYFLMGKRGRTFYNIFLKEILF